MVAGRGSRGGIALAARLAFGGVCFYACSAGAPTPSGPDAAPPPRPSTSGCVEPEALADTSSPTTVVGDGTPESCTDEAFGAAVAAGGVVTFDCGPGDLTIFVMSEKVVRNDVDTIIDGGGRVTLDGRDAGRALALRTYFDETTPKLTVQRLTFQHFRSAGPATDPDVLDDVELGGGAIYRHGGSLTVLDSVFLDNRGPETGQDVAGGAVYAVGGGPLVIVGSTFVGNQCSDGGAVGALHTGDVQLVNVHMESNRATGFGGNPGNGGVGGAYYSDGSDQPQSHCGLTIIGNHANVTGGGFFRFSLPPGGTTTIAQTLVDGNRTPNEEPSGAGGMFIMGQRSLSITDSTISNNEARFAGGVFLGDIGEGEFTNVTISDNTATSGLAGGLYVDRDVDVTLRNCTLAANQAPGPVAFAAAIEGSGLTLQNCLVDGHVAGNAYNPVSCRSRQGEGGGNLQWPAVRGDGEPDELCTRDIELADSSLGPLQDNGGPTPTRMPGPDSPAIGRGVGCPEFDQRGERRGATCTSGAVEYAE